MPNDLVSMSRRLTVLETAFRNSKVFSGTVTNNADPENRNRVKATVTDLFGESLETDWLLNRNFYSGNGTGEVFTPSIGDEISISFRDGRLDAGEYFGGTRGSGTSIPEEFQSPDRNGIKSKSGTVLLFNDEDGSWEIYTTSGGKIFINSSGEIHFYGCKSYVHAPTELNSDRPQFGVTTNCPLHMCPFGWLHPGLSSVKAGD